MNYEAEKPRNERTPITEAFSALASARMVFIDEIQKHLFKNTENRDNKYWGEVFDNSLFGVAWDDDLLSGDKSVLDFIKGCTTLRIEALYKEKEEVKQYDIPLEGGFGATMHTVRIITSYAVQAIKAENSGNRHNAWTYAVDARFFEGCLHAHEGHRLNNPPKNPAAEMAKKRHAENKTLVEEAIEHWQKNIDPTLSAQKAATELQKIVPLSHKKLAEVVSQEKKKLT